MTPSIFENHLRCNQEAISTIEEFREMMKIKKRFEAVKKEKS